MSEIIPVGTDLVKTVFQVHGADSKGHAVLRKPLGRAQVLEVFARLSACLVAMEVCGGAHFRGRELARLGHDIRRIPPACVKPFLKRQKNDAADAEAICEAICEAAQRPDMRFVPVKREETQGAAKGAAKGQPVSSASGNGSSGSGPGPSMHFADTSPGTAGSCHRARRMPGAWLPLVARVADEESGLPATARTSLTVLTATPVAGRRFAVEQVAPLALQVGRRRRLQRGKARGDGIGLVHAFLLLRWSCMTASPGRKV